MKEYILINRVPENYSASDAQSVMPKWNALTEKWKVEGAFVSSFVFPSDGFLIFDQGNCIISRDDKSNGLKVVTAIVLIALNYEQAIEMAKSSPILTQNGTVEVVETLKRPSRD